MSIDATIIISGRAQLSLQQPTVHHIVSTCRYSNRPRPVSDCFTIASRFILNVTLKKVWLCHWSMLQIIWNISFGGNYIWQINGFYFWISSSASEVNFMPLRLIYVHKYKIILYKIYQNKGPRIYIPSQINCSSNQENMIRRECILYYICKDL